MRLSARSGSAMRLDAVVVGAHGDERALVVEALLEDHDLALDLVAGRLDDVQAFVEHDLLAGPQRLRLERRTQADLHLPSLREDVHGAVLVGRQVEPVRRRGRAQLVDLGPQRDDLLARHRERLQKLVVLRAALEGMRRAPWGIRFGGHLTTVHGSPRFTGHRVRRSSLPIPIATRTPDAGAPFRGQFSGSWKARRESTRPDRRRRMKRFQPIAQGVNGVTRRR